MSRPRLGQVADAIIDGHEVTVTHVTRPSKATRTCPGDPWGWRDVVFTDTPVGGEPPFEPTDEQVSNALDKWDERNNDDWDDVGWDPWGADRW